MLDSSVRCFRSKRHDNRTGYRSRGRSDGGVEQGSLGGGRDGLMQTMMPKRIETATQRTLNPLKTGRIRYSILYK